MNLGELIGEYRIRTLDNVAPYFCPNEELITWFNEAETEASIRAKLIVDSEEFSVSAGDSNIQLPQGLFDIQYVELRDASGEIYELTPTSRGELDLDSGMVGWRSRVERPEKYIHEDRVLVFSSSLDADYTAFVEFFRTPLSPMQQLSDSPEIAGVHHAHLINWVKYRALSKPDADLMSAGSAGQAEAEFAAYFGKRPNANLRRRQNASRPHRNQLCL